MKYAYNDNNTLRDVVMANPFNVFQPGYASLFIEVPDECETGWILENGKWVKPPEQQPEEIVPTSVTARQGWLYMHREGLLGQIEDYIDSQPEPEQTEARIEWEKTAVIERNNPMLAQIAETMQWDDERLDEMFLAASKL